MERAQSIESTEPQMQVRFATVLKCDLVSSTRVKRQLDLDGQVAFQNAFENIVLSAALRHGARVSQFEGDGALVMFGFPDPEEDLAEIGGENGVGAGPNRRRDANRA